MGIRSFRPAGRWFNEVDYTELDFYFRITGALDRISLDLGLRWEAKVDSFDRHGCPILVPNQPVKLGAAPSSTVRWVE